MIGGGAGGADGSALHRQGLEGAVDVTLIEPTRMYYTCFSPTFYIGGFRDLASIGHTYGKLASDYGINVVHDWATGVDRAGKTVSLSSGVSVPYDALVVSRASLTSATRPCPAIRCRGRRRMPHAYKAGTQTAPVVKSRSTPCPQAAPHDGGPAEPLPVPPRTLRAGLHGGPRKEAG